MEDKFSRDMVLYFRYSELFLLEKIFLYAKKLFFSQKEYDLCDNFDQLVHKGKKTYYIHRSNRNQG